MVSYKFDIMLQQVYIGELPIGLTLSTVPSIRNCDTTSLKFVIAVYLVLKIDALLGVKELRS